MAYLQGFFGSVPASSDGMGLDCLLLHPPRWRQEAENGLWGTSWGTGFWLAAAAVSPIASLRNRRDYIEEERPIARARAGHAGR